jgi:hypothetical protein
MNSMPEMAGRSRFYPSADTAEKGGLAMRSTVNVESLGLTAPNAELIAGLATVFRAESGSRSWWPWAVAVLGMVAIIIGAVLFTPAPSSPTRPAGLSSSTPAESNAQHRVPTPIT